MQQQRAPHADPGLEGQAKLQRVLRELPAKPTQRNARQHEEDVIAESRRLDCVAFAGVAPVQDQQLATFEDAWRTVDEQLKELRERLLAPVFEQVRDFARTHAASASSRWSDSLVPTVLLSTGLSADHAHTYPDLMLYLRSQGHNVALISAVQPTGGGLGSIVQSLLRQFMGAGTHADDMQALLAWWAEEVDHSKAATAGTARGSGAQGAGDQAAETTAVAAAAAAAAAAAGMEVDGQPGGADQGAAGRSSSARPGRAAQPKRVLQSRHQAGGPQAAAAAARTRVLQPPVLIIQEAEGSDMGVMQDLVTLLHQERLHLPVTLVLGFSTAPGLFEQLLPSGIGRRIAQVHVALPLPRDHLHALWRGVLLRGSPPALVLGPQCAAWVLRQFHEVDASTALLESSMQLAFMEHFQQQPLSVLLSATTSGNRKQLHKAVQQLPMAVLQQCHAAVSGGRVQGRGAAGGSKGPSEAALREAVEAPVWQAMQAYAQWRLAVLLTHAAALCTGAADGNAALQLPALYAAASSSEFNEATTGRHSQAQMLLQELCSNSGSASIRLQQGEQFDDLLQKLLIVARAAVAAPERPKQEQQDVILVDHSDIISSSSEESSNDSNTSSSDSESAHQRPAAAAARVAAAPAIAPLLQDCPDVLQLLAMLEALADETAGAQGSSEGATAQEHQEGQASKAVATGVVETSLGVTPLAARLKGSANISTPTTTPGARSPEAGAGGSGLGVTPLAARLAQVATVQSPTSSSRAKENRQRHQPPSQAQQQLQRPSRQATRSEPAKAQAAGTPSQPSIPATVTANPAAKATPNARTARLMSITARAAQPLPAAAPMGMQHQTTTQQKGTGKASPAARLAAALEQVLPQLMAAWARRPPGAAAFMFDDAASLQAALCPAPRVALHSALAHPNLHLPGCAAAMGPEWEDACIAYGLLERHDGDMMPTAEWFGQFASVHGLRPGGQDEGQVEEDEEAGGQAKRRRTGAKRVRGGKTKVRPDDAAQVAAAQAGRRQRVGAARAAATAQVQAAAAGAGPSAPAAAGAGQVNEKKLVEAAARFCQAVNELQFVGAWRSQKRRKVASVQRTLVPMMVQDVHGPGAAA